jgi:hypothetical protein
MYFNLITRLHEDMYFNLMYQTNMPDHAPHGLAMLQRNFFFPYGALPPV